MRGKDYFSDRFSRDWLPHCGASEQTWQKVKLLAKTHNPFTVLAHVEKLIYMHPLDARLYCISGMMHENVKNYEQAIKDLSIAEQLQPKHSYIKYRLALLYLKHKRIQEAKKILAHMNNTDDKGFYSRILKLINDTDAEKIQMRIMQPKHYSPSVGKKKLHPKI